MLFSRTFATALCEDVVKPLKQLLDSQHRIRKSVENAVDKTGRFQRAFLWNRGTISTSVGPFGSGVE